MPKSDTILVLNAGSSSIKFSLYPVAEGGASLGSGLIEGIGVHPRFAAKVAGQSFEESWPRGRDLSHEHFYGFLLDWLPVLVDAGALAELERLIPLAPLHQPHNLAGIRALAERAPAIHQVACFDTAFHRSIPLRDQLYGLPLSLAEEGLRRYGFHGLSYEFIARALPRYDAAAARGRTVVAHLGNGASLCALKDGRSQACTMGFSTLDGLIMGTRCGAIDPGVLIYLLREKGMDAAALEKLLYKESGLLGLSGVSADMRDLLASGVPEAAQAVVFTAGIGERSAEIRARICGRLAWLGAALDETANAAAKPRISTADSRLHLWIVPTDEERMIAEHSRALLGGRSQDRQGADSPREES